MDSRSPPVSTTRLPLPTGRPLTDDGLPPVSTKTKFAPSNSMRACTREICRSGSGSVSSLPSSRPIAPPRLSKSKPSGPGSGAPLKLMT